MIRHASKKLGVMVTAVILALSSMAVTVQAATVPKPAVYSLQNDTMPIWDYIITIAGDITISDSGWTKVHVYTNGDFLDIDKIKVKIELQRLEDRSWNTIKTWTESKDASTITVDKETAVYKGYSYRLKVTTYVYKDGSQLEQATETFNYGFYN